MKLTPNMQNVLSIIQEQTLFQRGPRKGQRRCDRDGRFVAIRAYEAYDARTLHALFARGLLQWASRDIADGHGGEIFATPVQQC